MKFAQLNPDGLVLNTIRAPDDFTLEQILDMAARGARLVALSEEQGPSTGQRFDDKSVTFAVDPGWIAEQLEQAKAGQIEAIDAATKAVVRAKIDDALVAADSDMALAAAKLEIAQHRRDADALKAQIAAATKAEDIPAAAAEAGAVEAFAVEVKP